MTEHETERRQRFNTLFASYGPDIVAYCGWRAGSASDAQDATADPDAQLDVAVTVGEGDVVRGIDVSWGGSSAWTYSVTYRGLGSTDAPTAPENAQSVKELRQ